MTKEGVQTSLNSFDNNEILEAFEKQVGRRKKKIKPTIALPHMDTSEGIDWEKVHKNLLYPCYEATKLPVGKERDAHCQTCSECKRKLEVMDRSALKDNKWLGKSVDKTKEEIDWKI